ncbi:PstS family phosphate ABC transporter substrate-binding protein [Jeotgalibacillus soli]|uniref:Phosphate-binding protein n=1 Tax=Jeotgalibacillus soli TaxID=889306 RepID=A0A0C2RDE1_9BACL|nr:PstS family phosphate ABC transporter substrate-binding protein [Jeotgalibacillus soli]KIL48295.1 phosphate-binding protein [Jeotgalibacillus soli]
MKSYRYSAVTAMLCSALFLAACAGDGADNSANVNNDTKVEGQVTGDGSSTVAPIIEGIVEIYAAEQPDVKVSSGVSGTGGGFEKFIAGETDFSNASRKIKEEEAAALKEAGIDYTELELAYDGITIVVSPENDWVEDLTIDELKKIWIEDGTKKTWADIREGWPDEPIEYYSPGTDSGTYDYFNEIVLGESDMVRTATLSEDDNVLVQGVKGSPNAIGYFGYAYYQENKDALKDIPIDSGNGPVEPTHETIRSGDYSPLSRPLYVYVKNSSITENPAAADFITFTINHAGEMSEAVGYVSSPQEVYDEDLKAIEALK